MMLWKKLSMQKPQGHSPSSHRTYSEKESKVQCKGLLQMMKQTQKNQEFNLEIQKNQNLKKLLLKQNSRKNQESEQDNSKEQNFELQQNLYKFQQENNLQTEGYIIKNQQKKEVKIFSNCDPNCDPQTSNIYIQNQQQTQRSPYLISSTSDKMGSSNHLYHHWTDRESDIDINEDDEEMELDDFVKQIQNAGIDVEDLLENKKNEDNDDEEERSKMREKNIKFEFQEDFQNHFENGPSFFTIKNDEKQTDKSPQTKMQQLYTQKQQQYIKQRRITFSGKSSTEFVKNMKNSLSSRPKKSAIVFGKLFQIIEEILRLRDFANQIKQESKKLNNFKQFQSFGSQLQTKIAKITNNYSQKLHIKSIQALQYKILQLQTNILQKQLKISKQKNKIESLQKQNIQFSETIFDLNQKIAQSDLILQRRIQQIRISNSAQSESQVRRLHQEVEELTKLCEESQQQYKKVQHNERLSLNIELQKITNRENIVNQRELKLYQKLNDIEVEENRIKEKVEQLNLKEQHLFESENTLKQRMQKITDLEKELNLGFIYVESLKKQNQIESLKLEKFQEQIERKQQLLQIQQNNLSIKGQERENIFNERRKSNISSIHKVNSYPVNIEPAKYSFALKSREALSDYGDIHEDQRMTMRMPIELIKSEKWLHDQITNLYTDTQRNQRDLFKSDCKNILRKDINFKERQIKNEPFAKSFSPKLTLLEVPRNTLEDRRFQSQVIYSPFNQRRQSIGCIQSQEFSPKSPKLVEMCRKSASSRKLLSDSKICELGNKIHALKNQIKIEINSARKK